MRKLLLVALLLYDIVAYGNRPGSGYDYDSNDIDGSKRHAMLDDRRNWRKKALLKPNDMIDRANYEERKNHDYDRYPEDSDLKMADPDRQRELDAPSFRGQRRYDDSEKMSPPRSGEFGHAPAPYYGEKIDPEKKAYVMNCDRPHERYEACFAGCAAISCDNPRERLRPCYPFCEPGCICVSPFVRDERTHKCVMPDECTKGLKGVPDLGDEI
ncbi:uncharacterized protein LOC128675245 [Plodia interpunctella]|uniref:uncharacterized protein LOC128675245 n=1 Tax=Plodia interpunctella TaxID=58824 RepID=UPI002368AD3F|nr:uncharacterized protein LOC128675245 [Plodia interpunctella]